MAAWSAVQEPQPDRHRSLLTKRRCLARCHAAFAAALIALAPSRTGASISRTGFQNEYYQGLDYSGSRVLEQLEASRYEEYLEVTWTQSISVDSQGRVWLVDRNYHVLVEMPPATRYIPWPALYQDYAGTRGMPGFMNGSRKQSRFDGPTGIAVSSSPSKPFYLYVSDTNNHVVRRVDYKYERVTTVVGLPQAPGMRDGPSEEARLRYPQSLGLDKEGDNLIVLDNGRRVRHIKVGQSIATISTLVDGSCRSISRYTLLTSVEFRIVGCHTDWVHDGLQSQGYETFCLGHKATCGPRDHPAIQDRFSPQLVAAPGTTSTTTTLYNNLEVLYR